MAQSTSLTRIELSLDGLPTLEGLARAIVNRWPDCYVVVSADTVCLSRNPRHECLMFMSWVLSGTTITLTEKDYATQC